MNYLLFIPQDSTQTFFGYSHDTLELIKILISIGALLVSIFTFFFAFIRTGNTNKNSTFDIISNRINSARVRVEDFSVKMTESDKESSEFKTAFNSILEDYLNSYDEACLKFYNNSVKRKDFNRGFLNEINSLFNRANTREMLESKRHKFLNLWKYFEDKDKEKFYWSKSIVITLIVLMLLTIAILYSIFIKKG